MRFALTLLAWVVMVGGLTLYIQSRESAVPATAAPATAAQSAQKQYTMVLTPTFSVEADPFALQIGDEPSSAFSLSVNGQSVAVDDTALTRGASLRIDALTGLVIGPNEIYIKASPPAAESHLDHGVRLRLFHEEDLILDQTLWGEQGALVSGAVPFSLTTDDGDDHDH